jgi:hypothetical protein
MKRLQYVNYLRRDATTPPFRVRGLKRRGERLGTCISQDKTIRLMPKSL